MPKKSQISLFIILGILVVMVIFLAIYSLNSQNQNTIINNFNLDSKPIEMYTESCMDYSANIGMAILGMRGGYIFPLSNIIVTDKSEIAYFFHNNSYLMPPIGRIEKELATYMDLALPSCLGNFSQFENMGYKIYPGDIHTEIDIGQRQVRANVRMPLTIEKIGAKKIIPEFSRTYNVELGKLYNLAKDISVNQLAHPNSINFGLIGNLSLQYDIKPVILSEGNDTILYLLSDDKSIINNLPFLFQFAHQFKQLNCSDVNFNRDLDFLSKCIDEKILSIYQLQVEEIPNLKAFVGKPFVYIIKAEGIGLMFEDYSYLFEIGHNNGIINFTPQSGQEGVYDVDISILDQFGNEKYSTFLLNISEEI